MKAFLRYFRPCLLSLTLCTLCLLVSVAPASALFSQQPADFKQASNSQVIHPVNQFSWDTENVYRRFFTAFDQYINPPEQNQPASLCREESIYASREIISCSGSDFQFNGTGCCRTFGTGTGLLLSFRSLSRISILGDGSNYLWLIRRIRV